MDNVHVHVYEENDDIYVSCKSLLHIICNNDANAKRKLNNFHLAYPNIKLYKHTCNRTMILSSHKYKDLDNLSVAYVTHDTTQPNYYQLSNIDIETSLSGKVTDTIKFNYQNIKIFAAWVANSSRTLPQHLANVKKLFLLSEGDGICASIELNIVEKLIKAFISFDPITQFNIGSYRIDLYLTKPKLAIEIDEEAHAYYNKENDIARTLFIKAQLCCTLIRINPVCDDIFDVIHDIYRKIHDSSRVDSSRLDLLRVDSLQVDSSRPDSLQVDSLRVDSLQVDSS